MKPVDAGNGMSGRGPIPSPHPSPTSISSVSPSRSNDSNVVPVLSSTHANRRFILPFSAVDTLPVLKPVNARRRLMGAITAGSYVPLDQYDSGRSALILVPYLAILPQFHCKLHQIFTAGPLYVPVMQQILIPYIAVVQCCYKGLFFKFIKISLMQEIASSGLTFSSPKPVNNYDTFIVEKIGVQ